MVGRQTLESEGCGFNTNSDSYQLHDFGQAIKPPSLCLFICEMGTVIPTCMIVERINDTMYSRCLDHSGPLEKVTIFHHYLFISKLINYSYKKNWLSRSCDLHTWCLMVLIPEIARQLA